MECFTTPKNDRKINGLGSAFLMIPHSVYLDYKSDGDAKTKIDQVPSPCPIARRTRGAKRASLLEEDVKPCVEVNGFLKDISNGNNLCVAAEAKLKQKSPGKTTPRSLNAVAQNENSTSIAKTESNHTIDRSEVSSTPVKVQKVFCSICLQELATHYTLMRHLRAKHPNSEIVSSFKKNFEGSKVKKRAKKAKNLVNVAKIAMQSVKKNLAKPKQSNIDVEANLKAENNTDVKQENMNTNVELYTLNNNIGGRKMNKHNIPKLRKKVALKTEETSNLNNIPITCKTE